MKAKKECDNVLSASGDGGSGGIEAAADKTKIFCVKKKEKRKRKAKDVLGKNI